MCCLCSPRGKSHTQVLCELQVLCLQVLCFVLAEVRAVVQGMGRVVAQGVGRSVVQGLRLSWAEQHSKFLSQSMACND